MKQPSLWKAFPIIIEQYKMENALHKKEINFRKLQSENVCEQYEKMNPNEFEKINLRQNWANRRIIGKTLAHLFHIPVHVVDLCCGTGMSTSNLAEIMPSGSTIIGIDYCEKLITKAKSKHYYNSHHEPIDCSFSVQSILKPLNSSPNHLIANRSKDLVMCLGAIAHHFQSLDTETILRESIRLLKEGGFLLFDSGPSGTSAEALEKMAKKFNLIVVDKVKSIILDPTTTLLLKKPY